MSTEIKFAFEHRLASQVPELFIKDSPVGFPNARLCYLNHALLDSLTIRVPKDEPSLSKIFSGTLIDDSAFPAAQAYAGHQFGHFNPQLGDGRAHILGEIKDNKGQRFEMGFKGSGATPFSRGGDGKAALAPMLREVLISEAMFHLNIPTTRSLAVVKTGETVYRDPPQAGAVLTRLASSHLRIGSFQYFAAREQFEVIQKLTSYALAHHYQLDTNILEKPALVLLDKVVEAQANLIAKWMAVGFIHGVMNTDNMLIGGETIDFGPCAFMEHYNPDAVYSSIDRHSRYAYSNQAGVAQWNLARLAETLLVHIDADRTQAIELATTSVKSFTALYELAYRHQMAVKLGIEAHQDKTLIDRVINEWLLMLHQHKVDYTQAHRALCQLYQQEPSFLNTMIPTKVLHTWYQLWRTALPEGFVPTHLLSRNPAIIARNHLVDEALVKADEEDFSFFEHLLSALQDPFNEPDDASLRQTAPVGFDEAFVTYCGT